MIYEFRVYHAEPGKMDALHRRFATKTLPLFEKHRIKVIGFWVPDERQDEELDYLLVFDSVDQMQQAWSDFLEDPEWDTAKKESEKEGPLVAKLESTVFYPTSYSPLQ